MLGVVIPTLNEAGRVPPLLGDLAGIPLISEIVVADGGSTDGTAEVARGLGARVVQAAAGRASQLNAGARSTRAPWLAFLHADSRLASPARQVLCDWLPQADPATAAVFRFRLDGDGWFWRTIETGQRLRERLTGLRYGDQGLILSRQLFELAGGYPEVPLFEDVEILRRIRRLGKVITLPAALLTSPRRYEREGHWRGWLRHVALISLYLAGVPPDRLAPWYRPEPPPRWMLLIFAKAPLPGRVKTRLAADVGRAAATELYRAMGARVFERVREGPYEVVICYDPPGGEELVREWLCAPGSVRFEAQTSGDLGARMASAVDAAFARGATGVCVIGTDTPEIDRRLVTQAFQALALNDVVFGPARDGGYYLIALTKPCPALFHDIPWSTAAVLAESRQHAQALGLRFVELETLSDIDSVTDLV
ncbi:MAG: TIGR04283 family arsenosugar biosynthesis glycosyltransferase [Gemmatimonadetes bacterium]|nr:TIGR04283 family arsenosugar biosynthesis glycosyltransferase [Gemmatimonadota bacterium]